MKILLFAILICFSLLSLSYAETAGPGGAKFYQGTPSKKVVVRLAGAKIFAFNGIPIEQGWGGDLVYRVDETTADKRTMGPLGGIPLVDIWNDTGGVAVYNTQSYQEPFSVEIKYDEAGATLIASGGSEIQVLHHRGDYYDAVRAFALTMKQKGLVVQPAPKWAFDAIWSTYGFEEDFDTDTIKSKIPLLKELGIKTITIDSGWYGKGRGEDIEFGTGDFKINPDVIGSEEDWLQLIEYLHDEGFRVRIWWVPWVA